MKEPGGISADSEVRLFATVSFAGVGSSLSTDPSLMKLSSGRAAMEGREALATADERRLDRLTLSSGLGEGAEFDESCEDAIVLVESANESLSFLVDEGKIRPNVLDRSSGFDCRESL